MEYKKSDFTKQEVREQFVADLRERMIESGKKYHLIIDDIVYNTILFFSPHLYDANSYTGS